MYNLVLLNQNKMRTNLKVGDTLTSTISGKKFELVEISKSYSFGHCINEEDRNRKYFNIRYKDEEGKTHAYNGLLEGVTIDHISFIW